VARRELRKRDTAIFRCTFCAFERQAVPVARQPYFDLFPVRLFWLYHCPDRQLTVLHHWYHCSVPVSDFVGDRAVHGRVSFEHFILSHPLYLLLKGAATKIRYTQLVLPVFYVCVKLGRSH
jgi:hypothetical protein